MAKVAPPILEPDLDGEITGTMDRPELPDVPLGVLQDSLRDSLRRPGEASSEEELEVFTRRLGPIRPSAYETRAGMTLRSCPVAVCGPIWPTSPLATRA